jgi:hypothetical protein
MTWCIFWQSMSAICTHSVHCRDKQVTSQCTTSVENRTRDRYHTWSHPCSMPSTWNHVSLVFFVPKAASSTTASSLYCFKRNRFLYDKFEQQCPITNDDPRCGWGMWTLEFFGLGCGHNSVACFDHAHAWQHWELERISEKVKIIEWWSLRRWKWKFRNSI